MATLRLPGRPGEPATSGPVETLDSLLAVEVVHQQVVGPIVRGAAIESHDVEAPDDAVVELIFEGDVVQYTSVAQLRELGPPRPSRGGGGDDVIEVPVFGSGGTATRGLADRVLRAVRVLRVQPAKELADLGVAELIERFEGKLDPPPGLYRLDRDGTPGPIGERPLDVAAPYLLLLHGTFSSIDGTFSGLFAHDPAELGLLITGRPTDEWLALARRYGERILALQHKTVSVSPIDNALAVAKLLPAGVTLHFISHSRGGLVGELLCLADFPDGALGAFSGVGGRQRDIASLQALREVLRAKRFKVEKFVRVACPARGTILASQRLDLYLSVILNLFGAIPALAASSLYAIVRATALELIRRKADPNELPGLESMMPDRPVVRFLNQHLPSSSDLGVIAGDLEGEGFFGRLKAFATDVFYLREHDLVVNTDSMFGGMSRSGGAWGFYHEGPSVDHFSYFRNERTRAKLLAWLEAGKPEETGFSRFDTSAAGINVPASRAAAMARARGPVLIVVPDTFGSLLARDGETAWPDAGALARHGLAVLRPDGAAVLASAKDDGETESHPIVDRLYGPLVKAFAATHEVRSFAWDWRRSMADAGDRLAELIKRIDAGRKIDLVAHGAGGLVVRALQVRHRDAEWKKVVDGTGRALLLAPPAGGLFEAVLWCSGATELTQMLAVATGTEPAAVRALWRSFPGIVELLPARYLEPGAWEGSGGERPEDAALAAAKAFRRLLASPLVRYDRLHIVTGQAAETPIGFDSAGRLLTTTAGDGRVADADLPAGEEAWRVAAPHDELAAYAGAFAAYGEILAGKASRLPRAEKIGTTQTRPAPAPAPVLFPTSEGLLAAAAGAQASRVEQADYPLNVSVTHGDLRVASHPVAVGHYVGDSIVSAEAVLDQQLGRRLSQRFQMGLYPALAGSVEVIRVGGATPPGAIVIGLGNVGDVTAEVVRRGIAVAALRYALSVAEDASQLGDGWRSAAISSVLVGTRGGSALTMQESIGAILHGALDANRSLRAQKLWDRVRIDAIEIIELYEQRAISCLRAARAAARGLDPELARGERIDVAPLLRSTVTGQFRLPEDDLQSGWWQRLEITGDRGSGRPFRYLMLTDRARAEATLQCSQRQATRGLIAAAVGRSRFDVALSSALFELLLPNAAKDVAESAPNMVLILDRETAQYPWEMLSPRTMADEPFAVRAGVLRQFVTAQFRLAPRPSELKTAFVVGDTDNGGALPPLDGAQAEANAVAAILETAGYAASKYLRPAGDEVIKQLFARPYRLLHLAGHGYFDADHPAESGMVLGKDLYLTACQLRQLRTVPDFVFINCCFLGQIGGAAKQAPHRLAASVARELIDIGVKAIVAAGWAVDDGAASTFAVTLYEELLQKGARFGDAVRSARNTVYRRHGDTNTWAAYQCYGNPGFMLAEAGDGQRPSGRDELCARREYVDEIRSIVSETASSARQALKDLEGRIPPQWRDGEMLADLGLAWRSLGCYDEAIEALTKAVDHQSATAPLIAIEQLINMLFRRAVELSRRDKAGRATAEDRARLARLLEEAKRRMELLDHLVATPERQALQGSGYKKLAGMASGEERKALLKKAAAHYRRAAQGSQDADRIYPLLNAIAVEWLLRRRPAAIAAELAGCEKAVAAKSAGDSFWDRVGWPDYLLTRGLLKGDLAQQCAPILVAYGRARDKPTVDSELLSAIEQIEWIVDILEEDAERASLRSAASEIARRLRDETKLTGSTEVGAMKLVREG